MKVRPMLRSLSMAWFNILLVSLLLVINAIVIPASRLLSKANTGTLTRFLFCAAAKLMMALSPQLQLRLSGGELWDTIGSNGRPAMLLLNHSSFFDFFALCLFAPMVFCVKSRILVSEGITKIPLFGRLVSLGEGIPVYFKKADYDNPDYAASMNDFSVEKDKVR